MQEGIIGSGENFIHFKKKTINLHLLVPFASDSPSNISVHVALTVSLKSLLQYLNNSIETPLFVNSNAITLPSHPSEEIMIKLCLFNLLIVLRQFTQLLRLHINHAAARYGGGRRKLQVRWLEDQVHFVRHLRNNTTTLFIPS